MQKAYKFFSDQITNVLFFFRLDPKSDLKRLNIYHFHCLSQFSRVYLNFFHLHKMYDLRPSRKFHRQKDIHIDHFCVVTAKNSFDLYSILCILQWARLLWSRMALRKWLFLFLKCFKKLLKHLRLFFVWQKVESLQIHDHDHWFGIAFAKTLKCLISNLLIDFILLRMLYLKLTLKQSLIWIQAFLNYFYRFILFYLFSHSFH